MSLITQLGAAGFMILGAVLSAHAAAADFAEGRALYDDTCSKCHGVIAGDPVTWRPDQLRQFAVVMPLGPNLSDIVGRTAGIIEGYVYSNAFREMSKNPWIWDEDALDLWLTDSQAFVNGSTMYVKADAGTRQKIISYLKEFAPYNE